MRLEVLQRHQIDDTRWNDFIAQSSLPCIYATTWFLDIINPQWEAIVILQDASYQAVMPVPVRQKLGFQFVHQPIYCQFLGVFSKIDSAEINQQFLDFFLSNYKNIIKYSFNPNQHFEGFETNYTHVISLDKSLENQSFIHLKKGIKERTRAQKHGWEIHETKEIEHLVTMFKANHEARVGNVSQRAYETLRTLHEVAESRGNIVVFDAISPQTKQVEGAVLFWNFGGRLIYQFCAATPFGRKKEARRAMLLHVIEAFANQGFILDFETTNEEGFRWFHLSFGAEEVYFPIVEMKNVSFVMRLLKTLREWLN
jgi:hypothetical protein